MPCNLLQNQSLNRSHKGQTSMDMYDINGCIHMHTSTPLRQVTSEYVLSAVKFAPVFRWHCMAMHGHVWCDHDVHER
jgi:hypothetical protein